jgi:transcriptional regulator with XRE-family HTH domain
MAEDIIEHGTRSRYVLHRCRCSACRHANATYEALRALRSSHRVPADRARSHLRALQDTGLSLRDIAAATSTSRSTVERILNGQAATIRSVTEAAILSARTALPARIPGERAGEILDALEDAGYSASWVSNACGEDLRVRGRSMCRRRFQAVAALATRLGAEIAPDGRMVEPPLPAVLRSRLDAILTPAA